MKIIRAYGDWYDNLRPDLKIALCIGAFSFGAFTVSLIKILGR